MSDKDDEIERLKAMVREGALSELAALGQASDARCELLAANNKIERAAAVLRLCLKYNTAMHSGAAAHNKSIRDGLAELEAKP